MLNYKHILVATDLSDNSDHVIKKAVKIAKNNEASVSVVHVLEHSPIAYGGEFSIPIDPNFAEQLERNTKQLLAKVCKKHGIEESNQYVTFGSVKHQVNELAAKVKADLIVIGANNHHGLELLLGSRANALLHAASCDVIVIKSGEK